MTAPGDQQAGFASGNDRRAKIDAGDGAARSLAVAGIVRIQLARFERLLADRRLTLALDDTAAAWLADKGYDPVYGARPLKRVIQKELVDPIARKLLAGEIEDGSVIAVSAGEGGLEIGRARVH